MPTWKVVADDSEHMVTASNWKVNDAGVLMFTLANGELVRAFAPGFWRTCEMVSQGNHGYGR